jgi:hypothetical protein
VWLALISSNIPRKFTQFLPISFEQNSVTWRWKQYVSPKRGNKPDILHDVKPKDENIWTKNIVLTFSTLIYRSSYNAEDLCSYLGSHNCCTRFNPAIRRHRKEAVTSAQMEESKHFYNAGYDSHWRHLCEGRVTNSIVLYKNSLWAVVDLHYIILFSANHHSICAYGVCLKLETTILYVSYSMH